MSPHNIMCSSWPGAQHSVNLVTVRGRIYGSNCKVSRVNFVKLALGGYQSQISDRRFQFSMKSHHAYIDQFKTPDPHTILHHEAFLCPLPWLLSKGCLPQQSPDAANWSTKFIQTYTASQTPFPFHS